MRFHFGNYEELKERVRRTGLRGIWRDLGNQKQYKAENGAVLNWWESTHTILFQGKEPAAAEFRSEFFATDCPDIKGEAVAGRTFQ
jgi:hypothetical protein